MLVEEEKGGGCDNFIGMTIDCTEGTAYDFPYQSPGDMDNITIRRASGDSISEDGPFGIVGIYGPAAYRYGTITIDGVTGLGSAGVQLANYSATNQNKLVIDRLVISNVRALVSSAQVELTAGAVFDIGELIVDRALGSREDVRIYRADPTATGNIRSLTLRNCTFWPYDGAAFTRTVPVASFGGVNIGALSIVNTEGIVMAVNVKAFEADGAANIPKIGIRDCSATGTGTAHLWGDTGGGTAAAPVYNNATYNGAAL